MSNKHNTVGQLVNGPKSLGKQITVHPNNGEDFSGKVLTVNLHSAVLMTDDGKKSVSFTTSASVSRR
ncbi:hypothetical protein IID19_05045 [Patescibacteria group bacterium]|nr:hypothetical protein [Patescibacteria group bacterium]